MQGPEKPSVEECPHEKLEISDDGVYVCKNCRTIVGFS